MSGITAAKTLHDHGYTNIQILEGSNRVGGRIKACELSGYTVEVGAHWVYGLGLNPVAELAKKYGLDFIQEEDTWTFRDKYGNNLTDEGDKEYEVYAEAIERLDNATRQLGYGKSKYFTLQAGLRIYGWDPTKNVADTVEYFKNDFENGIESSAVSGVYLSPFEVFLQHQNDQRQIVKDPRGFSYIVEQLTDSFINDSNNILLLNKKVTEIENWNGDDSEVLVHTKDGSIYNADFIILTLSVGVLQSEKVLFNPPLPKWKVNAIHKFGFAQYLISYLKFDRTFWDNTQTILYVSDKRGHLCAWFNMNTLYPGSNILQVAVVGSEAKAATHMSDKELVSEAVHVLRNMYPNETVPEPRNFTTFRWLSDPLTMGAYSYWPPCFTLNDMDDLMAQTGNIFYAGEHLNKTNHGFVHSAYTSGISTALDLISCIEETSTCKKYRSRRRL